MKKQLTEIVYLLDRSGSMAGLERETIESYNAFISAQDTYDENTLVTTVLFDDKYELLYHGERASYARLSPRQYFVRGGTALLDAIGKAVNDVKMRISQISEECRPQKVIFVIATDGMENSSEEFTYKKIRQLVQRQQNEYDWRFLFFGANIDTFEVGGSLGMRRDRCCAFESTPTGMSRLTDKLLSLIGLEREED